MASAAPPTGRSSKRSSSNLNKSKGPALLSPLLRHLCGLTVTVELKSGRSYRGVLVETDNFMNVVIKRQTFVSAQHGAASTTDGDGSGGSKGRNPFLPPVNNDVAGSGGNGTEKEGEEDDSGDDDDDLPFDIVHIRGPTIRYIHLPPRADLARLIKDGVDRERRARDKYKRNVIRKKGGQR